MHRRLSPVRLLAAVAAFVLGMGIVSGIVHPPVHEGQGAVVEYLAHLSMYFVFTVLAYLATLSLKQSVLLAVVLGAADELCQYMWPGYCRPGLGDWLVDLVGIVIACMVIARYRKQPPQRRMTWQT